MEQPTGYQHAFFSEAHAKEYGFSLCPLADDPGQVVRVTHVADGEPPDELKVLPYVGVIPSGHMGTNHYHLPDIFVCSACFSLKYPLRRYEQAEPEDIAEEDKQPTKRRILKAQRHQ
jgi:hypothetical protein